MNPLSAPEIRGHWATLICPWNDDDSLDPGRLAAEIDAMIAFGVDGIYSNGTAGEFHTQTEAEFDLVSRCLAGKCHAAAMPFQIGVSHMSAQISLDRLRRAVPLAPSAIQIILPDWFPLTDAEAIAFLNRMADAAEGIGLVLYNPPHAKRRLTPADLTVLADAVPQLVGIKVPGGDDAWYEEMRPLFSRLSVFIPGHTLATGFSKGAHGAYSNVACLHPGAAQAWWNQMQHNLTESLELESRIRRFMDEHIVPFITRDRFCNAACDRLMAGIGGWADVGSRMRWPYRSIPGTEVPRLREIVRSLLPEFIL
jgi:dihydrodipicolinate synthase/N-acetylneuraminate lyase